MILVSLLFVGFSLWMALSTANGKRRSKVGKAAFGLLLAFQLVTQSGFCWPKFKYFSDKELIDKYGGALLEVARTNSAYDGVTLDIQGAKAMGSDGLERTCCEVSRVQRPGDLWWGLSLEQTFWGMPFNRAIGICFLKISLTRLDAASGDHGEGQAIYVDPCRERVEYMTGP
jgi:hypothetical protein